MSVTPDPPRTTMRQRSPSMVIQILRASSHWIIAALIATYVFVLSIRGDIDHASVTALYGGILGHAGTVASQRLTRRRGDDEDDS